MGWGEVCGAPVRKLLEKFLGTRETKLDGSWILSLKERKVNNFQGFDLIRIAGRKNVGVIPRQAAGGRAG